MSQATSSTAAQPAPPVPQGLFLYGTDNKVYTVKDPSQLVEAKELHGFGIASAEQKDIPAPTQKQDVSAHDLQPNAYGVFVWHQWPAWGTVFMPEFGELVYCNHYHPYGTPFAIILEHHHHRRHF